MFSTLYSHIYSTDVTVWSCKYILAYMINWQQPPTFIGKQVLCASNVSFASSSNLTLPQPLPTAAASLQVSWPSTFSVMITLISLSRQSSPVRNDPSFRGEQPPMVFDLFFHSSQLSEIRFFVFSMSMSSLVTKQRRLIAPLQIVELDRSFMRSCGRSMSTPG